MQNEGRGNEGRGLERKGADIEDRLLDFAVRVGKAIDALPDSPNHLSPPKQIKHETTQLEFYQLAHFAISNLHYSLIIRFLTKSEHFAYAKRGSTTQRIPQ